MEWVETRAATVVEVVMGVQGRGTVAGSAGLVGSAEASEAMEDRVLGAGEMAREAVGVATLAAMVVTRDRGKSPWHCTF